MDDIDITSAAALAQRLLARPLLFVALAALAFAPLERLLAAHAPRPRRQGAATDLAFATAGQVLVAAGLLLAGGAALAALDTLAVDQPLGAGIADRRARLALQVGAGLLVFELAGYAYHRLAHRIAWMWRLHEIHHSSRTMDWLASFRQHPLEILLVTLAQNAPLILLGIPLGPHAAVLALLKLHTVFVHSNVLLPAGPWRHVVSTPAFHHRHHQQGGPVRNFASLLPFLDRLLGTHSAETSDRFGLAQPLPDRFLALLLHPLRPRRRPALRSPAS